MPQPPCLSAHLTSCGAAAFPFRASGHLADPGGTPITQAKARRIMAGKPATDLHWCLYNQSTQQEGASCPLIQASLPSLAKEEVAFGKIGSKGGT